MLIVFGVEKHYVGRLGILPNVAAVAFLVIGKWADLPQMFQYYIIAGMGLGALGVFCYYNHNSMKDLNKLCYALFSMKTVLPIYLTFLIVGLTSQSQTYVWFVILLVYFWYLGTQKLGHDEPFK